MLTSSVALILTSAAFIGYELISLRKTSLQNGEALAQVIAATSSAALRFDDETFGTEMLSKLAIDPTIVMASLYDNDGKILGRYPAERPAADFPKIRGAEGHAFKGGAVRIFVPVKEKGEHLGTLFLKMDLETMFERLRLYAGITCIVLLSCFLVALAVSNWLQRSISGPVLELAETAKTVSLKKDYLVRARKYGSDELGLLTDAFNHMLTQIHERDVALTESETRMRAVLNSAVSAVVVIDCAGLIIDWNSRAEQIFGWPRREAVGRSLGETIIPSRYRERHQRGLNHFLATGEGPILNRLIDITALRRDGTEFPVELSISPMKTGNVTTFCGFITDITERKQAAQALSLLAAIVESSDDAIIGKDLSGTIVSWNAGAERMFGYTAAEAIGKKSAILIPPDRLKEESIALAHIQEGRLTHFESARVRKDGKSLHVSVTMSPIKNAEGKIIGVSASSRDISDRIRAEEEIRALNLRLEERVLQRTAELEATNRELEAFTYSVSHDLRAPLRHIDAFAQILADELNAGMTAQGRKYIERIRHGVQNMGQLVDDLLNLSRVGRMEVRHRTIKLNAIVDVVLAEMKPEAGARQIKWVLGELPSAVCDPGLVKQVFTNLISNAVKYTRPREQAVIEIGKQTEEGATAIFVRDNGVGFNMKYADKLFGVFHRLHRAEDFEGTGVGLATVQRIIHLHEGRIWAEAELDKGATFYFTLRGISST